MKEEKCRLIFVFFDKTSHIENKNEITLKEGVLTVPAMMSLVYIQLYAAHLTSNDPDTQEKGPATRQQSVALQQKIQHVEKKVLKSVFF